MSRQLPSCPAALKSRPAKAVRRPSADLSVTAVLVVVLTMAVAAQRQIPTFRSDTGVVSLNVSVKRGNTALTGLRPADFELRDNGVVQTVASVAAEAVPIDVTIFHDTSPSQAGRLKALKDEIRGIADVLRPVDRLRVLTIDEQVNDVFGWRTPGGDLPLESIRVSQHSSVFDPIAIALLHRPDVDRRHLIVALTDAVDAGSVTAGDALVEVAKRSEGALHLVVYSYATTPPKGLYPWYGTYSGDAGVEQVRRAADFTGGKVHAPAFTEPRVVQYFARVFEDFRTSYVLRYSPKDVPARGWHDLDVKVPNKGRLTIHARRGYFVDR